MSRNQTLWTAAELLVEELKANPSQSACRNGTFHCPLWDSSAQVLCEPAFNHVQAALGMRSYVFNGNFL